MNRVEDVAHGIAGDVDGDMVRLEHISKTYPGVEVSLRGTKLEWKGPALWARNLVRAARLTSSSAPPVRALRDLSFSIARGEIFGLVGPNGSGKTTLIKILGGLIRPTSGTGAVAGTSLDAPGGPGAIRKRVAYVSTTGWMGLEWPLTAQDNVRFFASLCGMDTALAGARTEEALRAVRLWEDRHKYPSQLSNGMRQRVILARALLLRTPLLLLDEPTVGLDPVSVRELLDLLRTLCRERGQTILLTDHQAAEMEAVADRIAVLHEGELAMLGTPVALREQLRDVTVIEVHTEEMDVPADPPPPAIVLAAEHVDRPGALGVRAWRVHAWKSPEALQQVLDWLVRPEGRVVFLAEQAPSLQDVLALPRSLLTARALFMTSGPSDVSVRGVGRTRPGAGGTLAGSGSAMSMRTIPPTSGQQPASSARQGGAAQVTQWRLPWWREAGALWAFGLREYRIWQSYRVNQVLWLTNLFVTTLLFFLLGKTIAGQTEQLLGPAYGTNYMSFVVVGVTVNVFINTNLADPYIRIQRSYFNGTMDLFLLSPMSIYTPLLGLMTKSILDDYPRLFFTFGFGMLLFGATFNFSAWPLALAFTALFLAAGFGLGMLSASSFYLLDIKKGTEPVQFVIQGIVATLLAGTYYPITVLPNALQWVACLIPHTFAFDALRRLLDPGAHAETPVLPIQHALPGLSPVAVDGLALGLLTVVLVPLGVLAYGRGIERARRNGTLTRWQ